MSDMRKLLESMDKFAGEKVGQKPGDQVRGSEKATKRKDGKHPFDGRLVGASESKSMLADLEKELTKNAVKHSLAEEFAQYKQQVDEFAPDDGGGSRKFIPWPEFIDAVKQIVGKDFNVTEKVIKSTIQDRFIPHDPMEYGPTMLYSYYEARAGRGKGAVSTRGSIQVGKYYPNNTALGKQNFITSFNLLKGHPFERHFDLTFDNIYKIANIIMGNTEGAYQMQPQQGVAEGYNDEEQPIQNNTAVEAYGYAYNKRDQRVTWRKEFSSQEAAYKWADSKNATVMGIRPAPRAMEEAANPTDTVTMDIPLMIRLFEYAREDAKTDMDLHNVAERLIKLSAGGQTLSMDQYDQICPGQETVDEAVPAPVATAGGVAGATQPSTQQPAGAQPTTTPNPQQAALAKQNQAKLQQNLANLKTAGVQIDPAKAAQTFQKTDTGAPMNAMDKDTIAQMAPAIGNVMSNPSTATQLNTLIKKAGGGV